MSPDEFAEERKTLEASQSPHLPHPSRDDMFEVRRQNARRGTFPDPLGAEEAEEERAVLKRAEKQREKARRPESRRESKVRYRTEHGSGRELRARGPEDGDWQAAVEGEYSPSPDASAEEPSAEEHAPEPRPAARRTRTTRRPATASLPAKWMAGLMSSDRDKPRKPGVPQRKGWRPERRYMGRIREEPGEEEEGGERGERRHVGDRFQSSAEESAQEDEHQPLSKRHAHSSDLPARMRRSSKRRLYDEECGPARLLHRPHQEQKGWTWAAIQRSGNKQCLLAGGVTLVRSNAFLPRKTSISER